MSDSPIKYRLIKKENTGARLGEIITPHLALSGGLFMPVGTATVKLSRLKN